MGTWTIAERAGSRLWSIGQKGVESTLTCTYIVRWSPASDADPYPGDSNMLLQAGMPRPTNRPPSEIHKDDAWVKQMICRTVSLVPESSRPYAWQVQAVYTSNVNPYPTGIYAKQTRTAGERTLNQYRGYTTLPANGTVSWPPTDIGGTKFDLHGTPRPLPIATETITLEYIHDRTSTSATNVAADPDWYTFGANQGTRNSTVMFNNNYKVGTLLYRGCQATLEQECWRLVHVWQFDNLMHLEQVPCPNTTGAPILTPGGTFAGQQVFQTDKVGWYQRYTTLADHTAMLPADIVTELGKAFPKVAP